MFLVDKKLLAFAFLLLFALNANAVDVTPPVTTDNADFNWHNADFNVTLSFFDSESNVTAVHYILNSGTEQAIDVNAQSGDVNVLINYEDNNNALEYWSVDAAGNPETHNVASGIKLDKTMPSTSQDYDGLWHKQDFYIRLATSDPAVQGTPSGVKEVYYSIYSNDKNNGIKKYSNQGPPRISFEDNNSWLEYWAVDFAGNEELVYATGMHNLLTDIKLDKTAPKSSNNYDNSWHNQNFYVNLSGFDKNPPGGGTPSGLADIIYQVYFDEVSQGLKSINADSQPFINYDDNDTKIEYWAVDAAGNYEYACQIPGPRPRPIPRPGPIPRPILYAGNEIESLASVSSNCKNLLTGIKLDKTMPFVDIWLDPEKKSFDTNEILPAQYNIFDPVTQGAPSGIASIQWRIDGVFTNTFYLAGLSSGTHLLSATATDRAGNYSGDIIPFNVRTGRITVRLIESETLQPIPNLAILFSYNDIAVETDSNGVAFIDVPEGTDVNFSVLKKDYNIFSSQHYLINAFDDIFVEIRFDQSIIEQCTLSAFADLDNYHFFDANTNSVKAISVSPEQGAEILMQDEKTGITVSAGASSAKAANKIKLGQKQAKKAVNADRFILKLKDEPAVKVKGLQNALEHIKKIKEKHNALLQKAENKIGRKIEKFRETENLVNTVTVKASFDEVQKIAEDDEVEAVFLDDEVKADLQQSVPLIDADDAWAYGFPTGPQGVNIRVAVIDSGIDYTHPAFGSCTTAQVNSGTCTKVKLGWNFVKNDNNIMDDYGHGTHVSGIIAAATTNISGVAPQAKIYAYKAINQNGSGYTSDIIAALEMAVDPNGDGNYADKAHVINMSLGVSFAPIDFILSDAANNAVDAGSVVVVAAGNDGENYVEDENYNPVVEPYYSLGSPATAEKVITVGAMNDFKFMAQFSSRGPAIDSTFSQVSLKPDVVAPGIDINAPTIKGNCILCSNTRYMELDGTSMAAPHVAGTVALLLEAVPSLSPQEIKSAVSNTGEDRNYSVYDQGGGFVNAFQAYLSVKPLSTGHPTLSFAPSNLSYGLMEADANEKTISLSIKNRRPESVGVIIEVPAGLKEVWSAQNFPGLLSVEGTAQFCLSGNSTVSRNIKLSGILGLGEGDYSGMVKVKQFDDCTYSILSKTFNVPAGFTKSKMVQIDYTSKQFFDVEHRKIHAYVNTEWHYYFVQTDIVTDSIAELEAKKFYLPNFAFKSVSFLGAGAGANTAVSEFKSFKKGKYLTISKGHTQNYPLPSVISLNENEVNLRANNMQSLVGSMGMKTFAFEAEGPAAFLAVANTSDCTGLEWESGYNEQIDGADWQDISEITTLSIPGNETMKDSNSIMALTAKYDVNVFDQTINESELKNAALNYSNPFVGNDLLLTGISSDWDASVSVTYGQIGAGMMFEVTPTQRNFIYRSNPDLGYRTNALSGKKETTSVGFGGEEYTNQFTEVFLNGLANYNPGTPPRGDFADSNVNFFLEPIDFNIRILGSGQYLFGDVFSQTQNLHNGWDGPNSTAGRVIVKEHSGLERTILDANGGGWEAYCYYPLTLFDINWTSEGMFTGSNPELITQAYCDLTNHWVYPYP